MSTGNLNINATWGPFSPAYFGISKILDRNSGSMLDTALFAGRRSPECVVLPDNAFDYAQNVKSGDRTAVPRVVPENVSPDYSSFSLRYFLDYPEGDTALAQFTAEDDRIAQCELTFANSSNETREYFFGLGLFAADASRKVRLRKHLRSGWIAGRNYQDIQAYQKVFGIGARQCLTRVFNWGVEDQVLAQAFGGWAGDRVTYRKKLHSEIKNAYMYFRYVKYGSKDHSWKLTINGKEFIFRFPRTWEILGGGWGKNRDTYEEWKLLRLHVGELPPGNTELELAPIDPPGNDQARIWLDGMLIHEGLLPEDAGKEELLPASFVDMPLSNDAGIELQQKKMHQADFWIKIPGEPERKFSLTTGNSEFNAETGNNSLLDVLRKSYSLPEAKVVRAGNCGSWGMLRSDFIEVPPESEKTISFYLRISGEVAGSEKQEHGIERTVPGPSTRKPFAEMTSAMQNLLLFNVNYPFSITGVNSHYLVPAKYFPIPYSWDGGFISLGLAFYEPDLALRQVKYFLADEDCDFPFVYCGSPVPTQIYALWEIYQNTSDISALAETFPGMKKMYEFFLGRTPGSAVNAFGDGFLTTYRYCYNLGIDDHPVQRWAEENGITENGLYSIILMTQILRYAKIMRNIAFLLGQTDDVEQYTKDILLLTNNIETKMWDEESGLYGWLYRNHGGGLEPAIVGKCAGDRSACTFLPLFAGLESHKESLLRLLGDQERFLTPHGISSVDMQAPYFNPDGYWNGGIWPVMNWYIWRGLLESGEINLARDIADKILKTWEQFYHTQYYFGEHFKIADKKMNGAANFGGLSAVLIPMREAYYKTYQVTTPYDVIVHDKTVDRECDSLALAASAPFHKNAEQTILVNMGKGGQLYGISVNDNPVASVVSDAYGHISFSIPRNEKRQILKISQLKK